MYINLQTSQMNRYLRNAKSGPKYAAVDLTVTPNLTGASAGQINCGDFIYKSNGAFVASMNTPGTNNANSASIVGISQSNFPLLLMTGVPLPPPSDGNPPGVMFYQDGAHKMVTTVGDSYVPGALVYVGANAQTVTVVSTNNGTSVGRVAFDQGPAGQSLGVSLVGAAGQEVVIDLIPALAT
jgi:hypothetical protein